MIFSAAQDLGLPVLWATVSPWLIFGAALAFNFRNLAEVVFMFLARRTKTGSATVGTVRIIGGWAVFVGTLILLPDIVKLFA